MGWCSATEIMDTALDAALALVKDIQAPGVPVTRAVTKEQRERLRPFVAEIAEKLREGDWDCVEESDYFNDFPQEMLGLDDHRYQEWRREQLAGWDGTARRWPRWAGRAPDVTFDL